MKFLFVFAAVFAVGSAALVGEYDTTIVPLELEVQTDAPYKEVVFEVPASSSKAPAFVSYFATRAPTTQAPTTARPTTQAPTTALPTTRVFVPTSSVRPQIYARNLEVSSNDVNAQTVQELNEINPDGQYRWGFQSSNGIVNQAQGVIRTFPGNPPSNDIVVDGAFAWPAPNGESVEFTYTADENGYQPKSAAIPTPPPTPEAIARAVEWLLKVIASRPTTK